MFESLIQGKSKRRGRRVGVFAAVSVAVHVVAVFGLLIRSSWAVEKLAVPHTDIVYNSPVSMPAAPPPPAGEPKSRTERRPAKRNAKAPNVQPQKVEIASSAATETSGDESAGGGGDANGREGGIPGGIGLTGLEGIGDGLDGPPPEPVRAKVVPPKAIRGLRIAGTEQITPPDKALVAMQRSGSSKVVATAKLCLTQSGTVQSVSFLKRSGYGSWDRKIAAHMGQWRYRPYRIAGKAVPVCTSVTFIYEP